MGRVVLADIGIDTGTNWVEIERPEIPMLDPQGHKYDRGLVHCLAGQMPGAIALAASSAAKSGAGYVRVSTSLPINNLPSSIVQTGGADFRDERIGCILVGPGLGDTPMLGDLDGDRRADLIVWRASTGVWYWLTSSSGFTDDHAILTPHEGEFRKLFGEIEGSKAERRSKRHAVRNRSSSTRPGHAGCRT